MSKNIPMVALRDVIVFPHMALHFEVGRDKSVAAVEKAMENDQIIFLAAQKDRDTEDPKPDEIYEIGTVSRIKSSSLVETNRHHRVIPMNHRFVGHRSECINVRGTGAHEELEVDRILRRIDDRRICPPIVGGQVGSQ